MKKTSWLIVLWITLNLLLLMLWPGISAAAKAQRTADVPGGELMLWMLPTVAVICLMPDTREEKK